jgi:hypothetical protein
MQPRTRVHDRQERSHDAALAPFMAKRLEIDAMLQRLTALGADDFGVDPDKVHWGHVGTLGRCTELLRQVSDSAFQEGEYAA